MTLSCVDEAIIILRKVLMKITGLSNEMIINGESIRGAELVTIRNGQKVPIGYDETCLVTYVDPIDDISVVEGYGGVESVQSYEMHIIVYGNQCKKVAQKIKGNFYTRGILDVLNDNGIGLLSVQPIENASTFMTGNTYVMRNDLRIRFDCVFGDETAIPQNDIKKGAIEDYEL